MTANIYQALSPSKVWITGKAAPSNSVGLNGQFFLNDTTGDAYQKISGVWTALALPSGTPGSVWRSGSGVPSNGLGANGDFYLNTANEDVYQKSGGVYSVVTNIKGSAGTNGTNGAPGPSNLITESSGPTNLTVGAIADGQLTKRSGSTFVGVTANSSLVGLGNVTNDAQLTRAAGDFSSFAAKTPVADADVFLLEDSAAAGAKKSITAADIATIPGLRRGALQLLPRAGVFTYQSEEFDTTLSNSWTWYKGGSPWVTQTVNTSVNVIDAWTTSFASSQPRIDYGNWQASHMAVQVPYDNNFYAVVRSFTPTSSQIFWGRIGHTFRSGTKTSSNDLDAQMSLGLFGSSSGVPTFNTQVYIGCFYRNTGAGTPGFYYVFAGTDGGTAKGAEATNPGGSSFWLAVDAPRYEYWFIQKIGTDYHGFLVSEGGSSYYMGTFAVTNALAFVGVGFREHTANAGSTYTPVHTVDFIRQIDSRTGAPGYGQ